MPSCNFQRKYVTRAHDTFVNIVFTFENYLLCRKYLNAGFHKLRGHFQLAKVREVFEDKYKKMQGHLLPSVYSFNNISLIPLY